MKEIILPALVGFAVGLPTLIFAIIQWTKTWNRENRQIATNGMEAALREGQAVLLQRLEFERIQRQEAEDNAKALIEENKSLRQENLALRQSQALINTTTRAEERRITDDRR